MKYPDLTAGDGEFFVNLVGGWENFQQIKRGALTIVVQAASLLRRLSTAFTPACRKFVAAEHFVINTSENAKVNLGDNFKINFWQKVERNIPGTILVISDLTKNSPDAPILEELGNRAETTLSQLWHLLMLQSNGEEGGFLLVNGSANVFYIKDAGGKLWAVDARWSPDGCWRVGLCSVVSLYIVLAGSRVVSRGSRLTPQAP